MSSPRPIELSIVIPTFNEEGNILPLYEQITEVLKHIQITAYELIFIDDGSSDSSVLQIEKLRQADTSVLLIEFSRNFGHQLWRTSCIYPPPRQKEHWFFQENERQSFLLVG